MCGKYHESVFLKNRFIVIGTEIFSFGELVSVTALKSIIRFEGIFFCRNLKVKNHRFYVKIEA